MNIEMSSHLLPDSIEMSGQLLEMIISSIVLCMCVRVCACVCVGASSCIEKVTVKYYVFPRLLCVCVFICVCGRVLLH